MTEQQLESRYHVGGMDMRLTYHKERTAIGRLPGVSS